MAVFGDAVQSISGSKIIGRYFTVVSFIPSTVFTTYFLVLKRSGAWSRSQIDLAAALTSLDLKDAVALGFGGLLLALALHPMQFTLVQIFEGYWGQSWVAVRAATLCTLRHRRRWNRMQYASDEYTYEIEKLRRASELTPIEAENVSFHNMRKHITAAEQSRISGYYPKRVEQIMPTRLGNVLRMHEVNAGIIYGMTAITMVPRLMLIGDPKHVDYVQDQRTNLDLAVRTAVLGLAAAVMTLDFMWHHGIWMLLALAPCVIAYSAYRGSIRAGYEYGLSIMMLIEFNRFGLYEKLHIPLPETLGDEQSLNEQLAIHFSADAIRARPDTQLRYMHPVPTVEDNTVTGANPPEAPKLQNSAEPVAAQGDSRTPDLDDKS